MSTTITEPIDHTEHIVLLQRVLRQIEKDPEHWNQVAWISGEYGYGQDDEGNSFIEPACGTSFCFAGWVAALDPEVKWVSDMSVRLPDATTRTVSDWAAGKLGLTGDETELFNGRNSLETIRNYISAITDRMLAEMYPPPAPEVKDYVVTWTRSRTETVSATSASEAEVIFRRANGYLNSEDAEAGRTITVVEAPVEEPPVMREWTVTRYISGDQSGEAQTVTAVSEQAAIDRYARNLGLHRGSDRHLTRTYRAVPVEPVEADEN